MSYKKAVHPQSSWNPRRPQNEVELDQEGN